MFTKLLKLMKNESRLMHKYSDNLVRPLTLFASYPHGKSQICIKNEKLEKAKKSDA